MSDEIKPDSDEDDLAWHALNYRTAAPQHAELMWQELEACVQRKIDAAAKAERERCAKIVDFTLSCCTKDNDMDYVRGMTRGLLMSP